MCLDIKSFWAIDRYLFMLWSMNDWILFKRKYDIENLKMPLIVERRFFKPYDDDDLTHVLNQQSLQYVFESTFHRYQDLEYLRVNPML